MGYYQKEDKIVVFGGSGYLGQYLIERLNAMGRGTIFAVARNESNLVSLKEKFPRVQIIVGDIADPWIVKQAMVDCDECYILSAMKHVGLAEKQVMTCVNSNIVGLMNIIRESFVVRPRMMMFISSDKAAQANGVYGCSKRIGEGLMAEAQVTNPSTDYKVIRYGNVWASAGSIITKWKPRLQRGEEVTLTDPDATRFFWTVQEAVDMIFECKNSSKGATPFIPPMKAVRMGTVLEACKEVYGIGSPVNIIGLQPGENKHETTDGITFSDSCEQFTKEEFKQKFLSNG